jgi:hypothetical protein
MCLINENSGLKFKFSQNLMKMRFVSGNGYYLKQQLAEWNPLQRALYRIA